MSNPIQIIESVLYIYDTPVTGISNSSITSSQYELATTENVLNTVNEKSSYLSAGVIYPQFEYILSGVNSIYVSSGYCCLYDNSNYSGKLNKYFLSSNTFTFQTGITSYIVADYNNNNPITKLITNVLLINESNVLPIFTVFNENNDLHILNWDSQGSGLLNKIHQRLVKTERFKRECGLALSESTGRIINLTTGLVWYGGISTIMGSATSSVDTISFYYPVSGVWNISSITQYNNDQYSNGVNLQTLSPNRYAVNWIYRSVEQNHKHIFLVLGSGDYTEDEAVNSQPTLDLPTIIASQTILVGRIIVKKGVNTAYRIDNSFDTTFNASQISNHENLLNLLGGDIYHYHSNQAINTTDSVVFEDLTLSSSLTLQNYTVTAITNDLNINSAYSLPTSNCVYNYLVNNYISLSGSNNISGDLIPSKTGLTLGSLTNPWDKLYVSGGTIYIDNKPISLVGNILTFDGRNVMTTNSSSINNEFNISNPITGQTLIFSGNTWINSLGNLLTYNNIYTDSGFTTQDDVSIPSVLAVSDYVESRYVRRNRKTYSYSVGTEDNNFLTIYDAIAWLEVNMSGSSEIRVEYDQEMTDTLTVNLPYDLVIRGLFFDATYFYAGVGLTNKPMIKLQSRCDFNRISLDGSTLVNYGNNSNEDGIVIDVSGKCFELKDFGLYNFNCGISLNKPSEIWQFDSSIEDCINCGVDVNTAGLTGVTAYRCSEITFANNRVGINLQAASSLTFSCEIGVFVNPTTNSTGLTYVGSAITYDELSFKNNIFSNEEVGKFVNGFDYTRTDGRDANVEMIANIGLEDKNPHAKINLTGNTVQTVLNTNVWTKATFTNTDSYTCKFLIENNKITYQSNHVRDIDMTINGSVSITAAGNDEIQITIIKNGITGSTFGMSPVTVDTANRKFTWGLTAYLQNVKKNDYFEIYMRNITSGNDVALTDLTWLIKSA